MKHATVVNPHPIARDQLIETVREIGNEDWTVHTNVVVEYPDDRGIKEVTDALIEDIKDENEGGEIEAEDYLALSFFLLSDHAVVESNEAYVRPDRRE